jgi:hypothetical protein
MSEFFDYRASAMVSGLLMGGHKSRQTGNGHDFYKKSRFLEEPEPSKLDLKMSLSDPFETLYVKSFRQRSKLKVMVLIDVSSSMNYAHKPELIEQLLSSIHYSVSLAGDDYEAWLVGDELQSISPSQSVQHFMAAVKPQQSRLKAVENIYKLLPAKPALVFLVSDFYWQADQFDRLLTRLSSHWPVPVVTWQSKEYLDFPLWRFVELTDLETGQRSLKFITKKQKQLLFEHYQAAKHDLESKFRRFQQRPFWLIDNYQVRDMSRYFLSVA